MKRFLVTACILASGVASGQPLVKPLTIVVPTSTSTGPDIISRELGPRLSKNIGQPVIIENRVGASGSIGIGAVANAPPDGYTILITPNTITMLPALHKSLPWNAVNDFRPVAKLAVLVLTLIVNPSVPANSTAEFIALAKSRPGKLNYASPGNGTPQHLGFELFKQVAGLEVAHVPYKGSSGAITDLVSGQVQAGLFAVQSILPLVKAGRIRMLASVGESRSPWTPDVPTFREVGLGELDMDAWLGALAPKNMAPELIGRLTQEFLKLLSAEEVREALFQKGIVASPGSAEIMGKLLQDDLGKWQRVVRSAGISAD